MSRFSIRVSAFVAAGLLAVVGLAAVPLSASASTSGAPFTDQNQIGWLTLCDKNGHVQTTGNINSQPFISKVVSSSPTPAKYENGLATLYAYQPVKGVLPAYWSGDQLTGASFFSDPNHPGVQSTAGDDPLDWFVTGFPLKWAGLLELRVYFTSVGRGAYTFNYPAAILRVTGNRWTLVKGGDTPCSATRSLSSESVMLTHKDIKDGKTQHHPKNPTDNFGPSSSKNTKPHPSSTPASPKAGSISASSKAGSSSSPAPLDSPVAASSSIGSSGGSSGGLVVEIVVALLIVAAAAGFVIRRRVGRTE
jgi:hypothetical protein